MHIFVEHRLLDISGAPATSMQNFSRNVVTEHRREISQRGREIFVISERNLGRSFLMVSVGYIGIIWQPIWKQKNIAVLAQARHSLVLISVLKTPITFRISVT